ncbi:MAG TPA: substrate-binding domain-containing protein [Azospirillum sp.]|nr:substrate-binding domain-containing protein [Azospirillum sp.]
MRGSCIATVPGPPRSPSPQPSPRRGEGAWARVLAALALCTLTASAHADSGPPPAPVTELRVCADPNNLPFSNERGEGFENRIIELLAADLRVPVHYTWWAQRRGFVRNTLKAGLCDVVAGVPFGFEMVSTTRPYYRSSYMFVSRTDRRLDVTSFNDPRLRDVRVGVQMIGNDATNTPPAHALSRRGIVRNVTGYTVYGDYAEANPPARIVDAVASGAVDVAVVWGPLAGYFAARQPVPLTLTPVSPLFEAPLPMVFDISMGVRRGDEGMKHLLNEALERNRAAVDAILAEYGVPRLDRP